MPLEEIYCRRTNVKSFAVLAGMPLKRIWVDDTVDKAQLKKLFPQLKAINKANAGN